MKLTPEDKAETRALRLARVEERRTTKELNQAGKRITWCREKLEMSQRFVCESTGIPPSSYCGREGGVRTDFWEELLVLAVFFDRAWQEKYSAAYPSFNGQEIRKISVAWLMFGDDELTKNAEILIEEFKIRLKEIEHDHWSREAEMKRQLDIMTYIDAANS
jgi:transcriptional regulator with XRE-family HTH domain